MDLDLLIALLYSMSRMFSAYVLSFTGSLVIGVIMARNKYVEAVLLPILDILQSIPILGFFPIALLLFIQVFPGVIGVELAIVFLLITSMIWNMIFGVYTSIKSLDSTIYDLIKVYKFGHVTTFFRIYVPASIRAIVANSIISWAGGWFFITSSEVITLGATEIKVIGIGTYVLDAFIKEDATRMCLGVGALVLSVIATYILLWNPVFEEVGNIKLVSLNIVYKHTRRFVINTYDHVITLIEVLNTILKKALNKVFSRFIHPIVKVLMMFLILFLTLALWKYAEEYLRGTSSVYLDLVSIDVSPMCVLLNLMLSLSRVLGVVALSLIISLFLTYISYTSTRSGRHILGYMVLLGEVLASIPAIFWWPILLSLVRLGFYGTYIISLIVFLQGSLWYSYFNLILFGISNIREEIIDLADTYRIKGWYFVKSIFIPVLLPSIATSSLSSWGGAWNASIVAEQFSIEGLSINLGGIGALMNIASKEGKVGELIVLALVLSLTITLVNKTIWQQIFKKLPRRFTVE